MSLSCEEDISKLWHLQGVNEAQRLLKNAGIDENPTNSKAGLIDRISGTN